MSIHKKHEGVFEVRWREGGRNKGLRVHGAFELAKKIERKKLSRRDENRHLDVKREVNFRMSALIDRYLIHYGVKKRSADREKSVLEGIRMELGNRFVREVDGVAVGGWYENLTAVRSVSAGTALRHFHVMHHMMAKASTIWSMETGLDRNPADLVEVIRPDDARDRYLSEDELGMMMWALDEKKYRKGTKDLNRTILRMRLIVLIAVTTGMRASEIWGLLWPDVMYGEGLIAVRAKLKGVKIRYQHYFLKRLTPDRPVRVFLSHNQHDREYVEMRIREPLAQRHVETWYAEQDIVPGDDYIRKIQDGLLKCDWSSWF